METIEESKIFDIGVKVINKFVVEAESEEEAIKLVMKKQDREILAGSALIIDYVYENEE
tara:strand:+ start:2810 stop:2986 length:177 start_codon:yes stop_codon:yes gene_type:complete